MHFDDLRQYIAKVDELGEVERINGADPRLELGAIYAINAQGPNPMLMLFDEIKGYPKGYRIATNLLGSRVRADSPEISHWISKVRSWRHSARSDSVRSDRFRQNGSTPDRCSRTCWKEATLT